MRYCIHCCNISSGEAAAHFYCVPCPMMLTLLNCLVLVLSGVVSYFLFILSSCWPELVYLCWPASYG